ncbi:prepilin peptidase [Ilumatobacter sp.]|uniref:prepilin peptidase n=1 Tax=Ilumatobacter sp. TaxID=1967498 RepID=UPI003B51995B
MPSRELLTRHPLEIATAALVGIAVWRLGATAELPAVLAFIVGGMLLSAIDLKVRRLPTRIVYTTLAAVTVGLVFASIVEQRWVPLATAVAGAIVFSNAFFLVWLFATKYAGMVVLGLGDVRLAALLGMLLGWYGLPFVLYGAAAGHVLALAVVAVVYVRRREVQLSQAFGPPLLAGALLVVLIGA